MRVFLSTFLDNFLELTLLQGTGGQEVKDAGVQFFKKPGENSPWLMFVLGAGAIVVIVLVWIALQRTRQGDWQKLQLSGNEEIFSSLCRANQLAKREAFLLRKLVYELQLTNPLLPFVDTSLYDRYAPRLSSSKQLLLQNIRSKIFR